ncbi:protein SHI RELATED SEQUENCE 3 [Cajanus cajan]|uniref:Protein SHI RELATED SEQUENCE 3 n=1 Tax=Cajanus cajan TaxID=3821 RepID=A0A151TCX7_CAJCA|nr:protein SHI RELATED SEQUENCE 3 [Cajanus cajan]KYP64920.1 hypothetical protein KK1_019533 [Cajanus cajan]
MRRATQGEEEEEVVLRGSKCQDCGNQAKKECSYSRCRTCCKNKGFQCQTHIKSTWTPADKRRHKDKEPHHFQGHNIPQNHNQINPCSGLELKFPAATNSMAIFRCVQVRSMDDAVNEIAYQTCVNIGGHVFRGLLYDQGPDDQSYNNNNRGESSMGLVGQQQNLGVVNNSSINTRDSSGASATMVSSGHDETLLTSPPYPFPLMPYFSYPRS